MNEQLLTVDQVCKLFGLKRPRVYELTRAGRIPFVLIGERQYRYSATAIKEFISRGGNQDYKTKEASNHDEKQ